MYAFLLVLGFIYYHYNKPDVVISKEDGSPYLKRWFMIPKNKFFNIYLHKFMSSDEDRALHDHPWLFNMSILLNGKYIEHLPVNQDDYISGKNRDTYTVIRYPFFPIFRFGQSVHRIELIKDSHEHENPIWTLFITGNIVRDWGFICKNGWISHEIFIRDKSVCN